LIVTADRLSSAVRSEAFLRLSSLLTVAALIAGCAAASAPLSSQAAEIFDSNSRVADLTVADEAEDVPIEELIRAISRADSAGTALRVVVADAEGEFVPASSIVDRYGGTAVAYQANQSSFEGASRDMSKGQLDRAIEAARVELDIGDSATAFVEVIEAEGLELRGRSGSRTLLLWLLVPAALFMLSGAYSYWTARKRRLKRQATFAERKTILLDWASQLGPEVESLRAPVAASPRGEDQRQWHDSHEFVSKVLPLLEVARTTEELDAAEMRISRTAIKLRDLRRKLNA